MSQLDILSHRIIDETSQDETLHVSFVVDGTKKASFSLPTTASINEFQSQIKRALQ